MSIKKSFDPHRRIVVLQDEDGELHVQPRVRTPFNYNRDMVSRSGWLDCKEPSKTQQNQKDDCDINTIVRRFGLTGQLPDNVRVPQYGDFTGVQDFQTAVNAVRSASESFMELPAELRARFDNDPQKLLEFVANGDNRDEAVKLGLVKPPPPAPVEPRPSPTPKEPA